jgi:class 3 adenylate cyclase
VRAGLVQLHVHNRDRVTHRFQLAHRAFASSAATAADVTATGLFRELFSDEVLSADQHIGIGQTTLVFTDLVGSTALYERVGDAAAYALVRRHFTVLFDVVTRHGGRVVKTVGDSVMASFDVPSHGVQAAIACVDAIAAMTDSAGAPTGLWLRAGVHTGSCLAIEANGVMDYFGGAVNLAARVESLAERGEVVVSSSTARAWEVDAVLASLQAQGRTVRNDTQLVKGVVNAVDVVRVRCVEDP